MRYLLLVVVMVASTTTNHLYAIELRPDGSWVPVVEFDLEGATFSETLHWISGWSYALTRTAGVLAERGRKPLFCPPGRGYVESRVMLTILNNRYKGQRISTEQAVRALWNGLEEHYPCPESRSESK